MFITLIREYQMNVGKKKIPLSITQLKLALSLSNYVVFLICVLLSDQGQKCKWTQIKLAISIDSYLFLVAQLSSNCELKLLISFLGDASEYLLAVLQFVLIC